MTKTLVWLGALSALACSNSSSSTTPTPVTVTDTTGHHFSVSCSSSLCLLSPMESAFRAVSCSVGYGSPAFVILWSRVLTVHAMNVSSGAAVEFSAAEPARPVACTSDAECTPWNATISSYQYVYACRNGICEAPAQTLTTNDVIALCQADIRWPLQCPYITSQPFASRMVEVAASCPPGGDSCTVPPDCKQLAPSSGIDGGVPPIDGGEVPEDPSGIDGGAVHVDGA